MSKSFESGVTEYVKATATVSVFFPVDKNGVSYCCCAQCPYFNYRNKRCNLNGGICSMNPEKYVGDCCPLERSEA